MTDTIPRRLLRNIPAMIAIPAAVLLLRAAAHAQGAPPSAVAEGMENIFGDTIVVTPAWITLTAAEKAQISDGSRSPLFDDTLRTYLCQRGGKLLGWGIVDNVLGKSQFITYLLGVLPSGEVAGTEILVYRESHGGEISREGFRRQFTGVRPGDRLVPGRDVKNISGATISSRAVTYGVAKLLTAFATVRDRIPGVAAGPADAGAPGGRRP